RGHQFGRAVVRPVVAGGSRPGEGSHADIQRVRTIGHRKRIRMRLALLTAVVVGVLAASLTGCSSVPADPRAELEHRATVLDAAAQDLLEAVSGAGFSDAKARGAVDVCQSQPVPAVSYTAGAQVKIGDDLRSAFDAVAAQLTATGWQDSG